MSAIREKAAWALAAALALLVVAAFTGVIQGGPLDPTDPPAPTMKTLQEVEPRTPISSLPFSIDKPGSYYLAADLTGVAGQNGIIVNSSDVTIDLRGFTLRGVPGSLDGIYVSSAALENLVIRDGAVTTWGGEGIDASDTGGPFIRGAYTTYVERVNAQLNGGFGMRLGSQAHVSGCLAIDNGAAGVRIVGTGSVEGCEARANVGAGVSIGDTGVVRDTIAENNGGVGISVGAESLVANSTSSSNDTSGISTGQGSRVESSVASLNTDDGISVGADSQVIDSTANGNGGEGIVATTGALVERSTANSNLRGIVITSGTVRGNVVRLNGEVGIRAVTESLIAGNEADGNGTVVATGPGIHVTGDANHIERNLSANNDVGYDVDVIGNVIVGNTAQGNTNNYGAIVAGNVTGPLVTSANVGGNTNPSANYAP